MDVIEPEDPEDFIMNGLLILYRFFWRNLQRAFYDLQLPAGEVLAYLADRLAYFARTDHLYRIKALPEWKIETVVETLLELETARREKPEFAAGDEALVRRHIGDFTLFMTGIFREYVSHLGIVDFYMLEGARSYRRVFELTKGDLGDKAAVFLQLSQGFERYSGALDYMKKVYFYYEPVDSQIQVVLEGLRSWN